MGVRILNDDTLLVHLVNSIRPSEVDPWRFRQTLKEIGKLALPHLLKDAPKVTKKVELWSGQWEFSFIKEEDIVVVAILRASLPVFEGMMEIVRNAKGGFIAAKRDEKTLRSKIYYRRIPPLADKVVLIPDPMLATGSTLDLVLEEVLKENPKVIKTFHCVAAPEGLERISKKYPDVEIYTVSVDKKLNDEGFIVPGLGDAGDRAFNTL